MPSQDSSASLPSTLLRAFFGDDPLTSLVSSQPEQPDSSLAGKPVSYDGAGITDATAAETVAADVVGFFLPPLGTEAWLQRSAARDGLGLCDAEYGLSGEGRTAHLHCSPGSSSPRLVAEDASDYEAVDRLLDAGNDGTTIDQEEPVEYGDDCLPPSSGRLELSPLFGEETKPLGWEDEPADLPLGLYSLDDLPADPLSEAEAVLVGAGLSGGRDLSDVLRILPASLLSSRILCRCLPGLAERWTHFEYLLASLLRSTGKAFTPDHALSSERLLHFDESLPAQVAQVELTDADSMLLFRTEADALRLLHAGEQQTLGRWVADGALAAEFIARRSGSSTLSPAQPFVAWLLRELADCWFVVRPFVSGIPDTAAQWRAALTTLAEIGVSDAKLPPTLRREAADELRADLRRSESALRMLPVAVFAMLADALSRGATPAEALPAGEAGAVSAEPQWFIERGVAAERVLLRHNLRLVIATVYRNGPPTRTLEAADLVQEGCIGLMRAIKKWEPARGYAFSTYATAWIRQAIGRAISDSDLTVRIPVHVLEHVNAALQETSLLHEPRHGERFLADDEATALGQLIASPSARQEVLDLLAGRIAAPLAASIAGLLTIAPIDGVALVEAGRLADDNPVGDPYAAVEYAALCVEVQQALQGLTARQAEIIRLRFGLDGGEGRTLEQIGQRFGLTRERIRQIEDKALKRLRHPSRSLHLRDFAASKRRSAKQASLL